MSAYTSEEKMREWLNIFRRKLSEIAKEELILTERGLEFTLQGKNHSGIMRSLVHIEFAHPDENESIAFLKEGQKFIIIIIALENIYTKYVFSIKSDLETTARELFQKDFDRLIIKN